MNQKIAIYSGEISSSIFIERLIQVLAARGHTIYVFGCISKKVDYPPEVKVFAHHRRLHKLIQWIKLSVLLGLFQREEKHRLDAILYKHHGDSIRNAQLKAYPFLWFRPDIVHMQWAKNILKWMWLKDFEMKIILSIRDVDFNYSHLADEQLVECYRQCFSRVDAIHAESIAISNRAQKYGAPPDRIKVIYNGFEIEQFKPYQKMSYDLKEPVCILSVGSYHWKKGYHLALDVLSDLKKAGLEFRYELIAENPSEEVLYQVNDLQLEEDVIFHGRMSIEALYLKMQDADLLLLPGLEGRIPKVALEALAIGLPVLSSDCGGMTEVITHGKNGWLFRKMDRLDLGEKINLFLRTSPEERAAMAQDARKLIYQQHHKDQFVYGVLELYKECV